MGNKLYPDELKDFALKMFLEVTATGKRQHSYQDIVNVIVKEFPKYSTLDRKTINNWATVNNWNDLFQQMLQMGMAKAVKEKDDTEQTIIDGKSNILADLFKVRENQLKAAANLLNERLKQQIEVDQYNKALPEDTDPKLFKKDILTPRDIIAIGQLSEETILNLSTNMQSQEKSQFDIFKNNPLMYKEKRHTKALLKNLASIFKDND